MMVMLTLAILLDTLTSPASHASHIRHAAVYSHPVRPMDKHCWEYSTQWLSDPVRPSARVPRQDYALACGTLDGILSCRATITSDPAFAPESIFLSYWLPRQGTSGPTEGMGSGR